jgi:hypothetical protein
MNNKKVLSGGLRVKGDLRFEIFDSRLKEGAAAFAFESKI